MIENHFSIHFRKKNSSIFRDIFIKAINSEQWPLKDLLKLITYIAEDC